MSKIKVMVVDDSALMRKLISEILSSDPSIEIVAKARNGLEALEKIPETDPDVITLDINMPIMDGVKALKQIMKEFPRPVVVISSLTQDEADITFKVLELGAVDYIPKPSGTISLDIKKISQEIIMKVKQAKTVKLDKIKRSALRKFDSYSKKLKFGEAKYAVAIGISTGGPKTLIDILAQLQPDSETTYLVAQHIPPHFTSSLVERLNNYTPIPFERAESEMSLMGGKGYLAPGGWHISITCEKRIKITKRPLDAIFYPSVDVLFKSVAEVFKKDAIGILLTGIGSDGAKGLLKIKENGGITIAESEETAIVFGMPAAAIEIGAAQIIAPSYKIPREIERALFRLKRRDKK